MGVAGAASARTWGRQWPERGLLLLLLLMTCWTVTTRAGKDISRRTAALLRSRVAQGPRYMRMGSPAKARLPSLFQLTTFDAIQNGVCPSSISPFHSIILPVLLANVPQYPFSKHKRKERKKKNVISAILYK